MQGLLGGLGTVIALTIATSVVLMTQVPSGTGPTLEEQLRGELPAALAADARKLGNVQRGAVLFYQAHVTCARCHTGEGGKPPVGPDLSLLGKAVTDVYLVESILDPSKEIKKGFATVKVARKDGRTVTGLLVEQDADKVVLRDLGSPTADKITVPVAEIEERKDDGPSSMPTGLVNSLASRQQFLDLVSYLRAIADGGPDRALALRPNPSLLAPPPLPAYERDIDHAGMIRDLGEGSLARGESIYLRVCSNCHGTKTQEGTMPTSLRFATGSFKNGNDPHAMYKTLTHGFNQMPAQLWMVPQQKYDVIHYLREMYLKPSNPSQYKPIDAAYLAGLPKGKSRGPQPVLVEPWSDMNYGTSLMATIEVGGARRNFAYKGVAVRLDEGPGGIARGNAFALYDHDTMRLAAFWTGKGFIDWNGINFNGMHQVHPKVVGKVQVESPEGPGWANPDTGSFDDPRLVGRDGRHYGPMPRNWLKYVGTYAHGAETILSYRVRDVAVLDHVALADGGSPPVLCRTLELAPNSRPLKVRVAARDAAVAAAGDNTLSIETDAVARVLSIPASSQPRLIRILVAKTDQKRVDDLAAKLPRAKLLSEWTHGGPRRWMESLATRVASEQATGPFAVDVLSHPTSTPWKSQMRFTGLDFLPDGESLAVCDWDGDVWRVTGIHRADGRLEWKRIASGLFQPLGLKVVDGAIHLTCRDQIVILRDLNGDGETDFYECFNDDQQVTDHFHEFAMDLQTDPEGNFYYTKGARHALQALVPQHGTLLKVSKDGSRTEILANGFRAPNGVCLRPDGTFYVTDQEGHWIPKNRVNWVKPGRFYGNLWGFTDVTDPSDSKMEPPICWVTNAFDRSPSQVIEVTSPAWQPLQGHHITLSYGYGKVFLLLEENKGDLKQGGLVQLPISQFPTGLIRGRFSPKDGQLYACGMYAWAGNQQQPGGLYRIRRTETPLAIPLQLHAKPETLTLTFTENLDPASVNPGAFSIKKWGLLRSVNYGSKHIDETQVEVSAVRLSDDRKTVVLTIPDLKPTMGMEVAYRLKTAKGLAIDGTIHNTIHRLKANAE